MTDWKNIDETVRYDIDFSSFYFGDENVIIKDKTGRANILIWYGEIDDIFRESSETYVLADKLYYFSSELSLMIIFKRKLAVYQRQKEHAEKKSLMEMKRDLEKCHIMILRLNGDSYTEIE